MALKWHNNLTKWRREHGCTGPEWEEHDKALRTKLDAVMLYGVLVGLGVAGVIYVVFG